MGIDIYAKWQGQSDEEEQAQITGFSVVHGHVGYLREAYHGEPYATRYLVSEAFESGGEAKIPARVLRKRLPKTLELVRERQKKIYQSTEEEIADAVTSFINFVELCEGKEKATGEPVTIRASW